MKIEKYMWHSRVNHDAEGVCRCCHKVYDLKTGERIVAWERAYFITAGDGTCASCAGKTEGDLKCLKPSNSAESS